MHVVATSARAIVVIALLFAVASCSTTRLGKAHPSVANVVAWLAIIAGWVALNATPHYEPRGWQVARRLRMWQGLV